MQQLKPKPNFPQEPKNNDATKQWQEYNEMQLRQLKSYAVMPIALMLLVAGCATNSLSCKSASVAPARVPELPSAARQQPVPQWCYPTCTEAVRLDSTNSLKHLTEAE